MNPFTIFDVNLRKALTLTSFCASTDVTRPALSVVNVSVHQNTIQFVSTDSYRLSLYTTECSYQGEDFSFNLPMSTVKLLLGTTYKPDKISEIPVGFMLNDDKLSLDIGYKGLTTEQRLDPSLPYPNYHAVLPVMANYGVKNPANESFVIDPKLLGQACTIFGKLGAQVQIRYHLFEMDAPIVLLTNIKNLTHIIMPKKSTPVTI